MTERIIHCGVPLTTSKIEELKAVAQIKETKYAITEAVDFYIKYKGKAPSVRRSKKEKTSVQEAEV